MALNFRLATINDAQILFQWRNDPLTRQNSRQTAEIDYPSHLSWLTNSLSNPRRNLYLAFKDSTPIGTVRFDQQSEERWELSWTVAKDARGQGLGKEMVKAATSLLKKTLIAVIKDNNPASTKIASFAGFTLDKKIDAGFEWILVR